MAKSKDDIKHGTAQARHLVDEPIRVAYTAGTPLEAGKIADSEIVDLFQSARNIETRDKIADSDNVDVFNSARNIDKGESADQPQLRRRQGGGPGGPSDDVV